MHFDLWSIVRHFYQDFPEHLFVHTVLDVIKHLASHFWPYIASGTLAVFAFLAQRRWTNIGRALSLCALLLSITPVTILKTERSEPSSPSEALESAVTKEATNSSTDFSKSEMSKRSDDPVIDSRPTATISVADSTDLSSGEITTGVPLPRSRPRSRKPSASSTKAQLAGNLSNANSRADRSSSYLYERNTTFDTAFDYDSFGAKFSSSRFVISTNGGLSSNGELAEGGLAQRLNANNVDHFNVVDATSAATSFHLTENALSATGANTPTKGASSTSFAIPTGSYGALSVGRH